MQDVIIALLRKRDTAKGNSGNGKQQLKRLETALNSQTGQKA